MVRVGTPTKLDGLAVAHVRLCAAMAGDSNPSTPTRDGSPLLRPTDIARADPDATSIGGVCLVTLIRLRTVGRVLSFRQLIIKICARM
jgi:hypothetical protein